MNRTRLTTGPTASLASFGYMVLAVVASSALGTLSGCATDVTQLSDADARVRVPPGAGAITGPGPFAVDIEEREADSLYGGSFRYDVYSPGPAGAASGAAGAERPQFDGTLFIGHGFMRDRTTMSGWAMWAASHGVRAVTVDFANSSWFGGNHDRNGADLAALAVTLESGPRAYMGFSAGGLAALVAAASDEGAVAWIGLDPVDSGELAPAALDAIAARGLDAIALFAAPSPCNAENNMRPAVADAGTVGLVDIAGATHCHFESPYDPRCESLCGAVAPADATEWIMDEIRREVARFAVSGLFPAGPASR